MKHQFDRHDVGLPRQEVRVGEDTKGAEHEQHEHFGYTLYFVAFKAGVHLNVREECVACEDKGLDCELAGWVEQRIFLEDEQRAGNNNYDPRVVLVEIDKRLEQRTGALNQLRMKGLTGDCEMCLRETDQLSAIIYLNFLLF